MMVVVVVAVMCITKTKALLRRGKGGMGFPQVAAAALETPSALPAPFACPPPHASSPSLHSHTHTHTQPEAERERGIDSFSVSSSFCIIEGLLSTQF